MRKALFTMALAGAAAGLVGEASAQTATATATYEVKAINEVGVSGNPTALVISTGAGLAGVSDNSTSWSVTTNESNKKVTAAINTVMPTGLTLKVNLIAPSGATSAGAVALTATAADVVTGISQLQQGALGVTYTLSATPQAGVVASATKTVTYTITAGI